jgi:hypothetical protein
MRPVDYLHQYSGYLHAYREQLKIGAANEERLTQTSQSVDTINIHGTAPTDTFSATPSERKRRIHLILDPDQRIEHHGAGLVQIQCVCLHPWLRGRLVRVPPVDVEGLDLGVRIAGLQRRGNRCHAADAHWGAQGGTEGREGAGGEACCHCGS